MITPILLSAIDPSTASHLQPTLSAEGARLKTRQGSTSESWTRFHNPESGDGGRD